MNGLWRHPLFGIGLLIRLVLIFGVAPIAVSQWYGPFLEASVSRPILDPWSLWVSLDGSLLAFPYGYAMWLTFLPLTTLFSLLNLPVQYAYELTLLSVDILLLLVLQKLLPGRKHILLVGYWLSPIVILASYGLGLNDIVPVLFLTIAVYFLRQTRLPLSGFFCVCAVSAKLSMLIAMPFFAIYLINNKSLRTRLPGFSAGLLTGLLLFGFPFAFSQSALLMLFGNPEMGKVLQLSISFAQANTVYVVPLLYLLMLYLAWNVRRQNFDLFLATTGISFLMIVLLTPASPGWFVWCLPFLILLQSGLASAVLGLAFSWLYALTTLLVTPIHFSASNTFELADFLPLSQVEISQVTSLLLTAMLAVGLVLSLRTWRYSVRQNDFFRRSRAPFVIGLAGDSGAGKDTFADSLTGLFGDHSVVKLSGDDYHLWDRHKPMWQVMTHLNPMANDLEAYSNNLLALIDGKSIQSRHYNHGTGKMSRPLKVKSNDFIIASGLHSLSLPIIRDNCNLRIYLDIDENLRRHFKLKRDVNDRGHSIETVLASLEKREHDAEQFIRKQADHADLILSLQPVHTLTLEDLDREEPVKLKLVATTKHGFNELSIHRVLVGVCGLHVDINIAKDQAEAEITIEGEPGSEDIEMAAKILCPNVIEFLDIEPDWQEGVTGVMQLVALSHINQVLVKRTV